MTLDAFHPRRAAAAGLLAVGSKAAMIVKSGGGVGTLAKATGLLAAGDCEGPLPLKQRALRVDAHCAPAALQSLVRH